MEKKAVKVFLDSIVILSGFISYKGAPRVILDLLSLEFPLIKGYTGEYNIIEIQRNMRKKVPEIFPVYQKYFPKLNLEVIPLPLKTDVEKYSGIVSKKDVPVILSAKKCRADFLVTGDKGLKKFKGKHGCDFDILTPSEFLEKVMERR